MKILGFIHVAIMGNWREILREQLDLIAKSGLRSVTDCLSIGVLGPTEGIKFFQDEVDYYEHDPDLTKFEMHTLRMLHKKCAKNPDSKVWYIHTKGASLKNAPEFENSQHWRRYMEHFVITNYKSCVAALDEHDICGVDWERANPHFKDLWGLEPKNGFSGNFWWANANYINKIDLGNLTSNRHAAEHQFVGTAQPRVKNFFTSNLHLYSEPMLPQRYKISVL